MRQYFTPYECLNLSLPIGVDHVNFEQKSTEKWAKRNISTNVLVPLGLVGFEVCVPPYSRVLWLWFQSTNLEKLILLGYFHRVNSINIVSGRSELARYSTNVTNYKFLRTARSIVSINSHSCNSLQNWLRDVEWAGPRFAKRYEPQHCQRAQCVSAEGELCTGRWGQSRTAERAQQGPRQREHEPFRGRGGRQ